MGPRRVCGPSEKMVKFLTERGAQAEVIEAARDMVCDTCVESQDRRKRSQPSRIHEALDFNDVVGADGAYWTNKNGKTFHFMHFIDEFPILYERLQKKQKLPLSIFGGKLITKKNIKFH